MPGIRYRPPLPPSTALISKAGYDRLREELTDLYEHRRPEVVAALSAAAAEGDRSENAEYLYRKKQLGEIDRRVRYVSKLLKRVEVVQQKPFDQSKIYFGAQVTVEDDDGQEFNYQLLGPDETDAHRDAISIDSPLAQALLKKSVDDEVRVQTPGGLRVLFVTAVAYP